MAVADQALWVIERNSDQALTLTSIAAACGVSRSHLASAFGMASGWPIMKYLRARRLSEAAVELASGAPDILSLALRSGYGSHEAFTRAFRDMFECTPEAVRSRASTESLPLIGQLELRSGKVRAPLPRVEQLEKLRLVGLSMPCSYKEIGNIPAQWRKFMSDSYAGIPRKVERMPIGVCAVPDEDGAFEYVCAAEVEDFGRRHPTLSQIETRPGSYAVFEHNDHVSTIFDSYTAIWNESLPAMARTVADGPVLEFHKDEFDPDTGFGGLQIWVPLEAT